MSIDVGTVNSFQYLLVKIMVLCQVFIAKLHLGVSDIPPAHMINHVSFCSCI